MDPRVAHESAVSTLLGTVVVIIQAWTSAVVEPTIGRELSDRGVDPGGQLRLWVTDHLSRVLTPQGRAQEVA
jgi:hypothetical protein